MLALGASKKSDEVPRQGGLLVELNPWLVIFLILSLPLRIQAQEALEEHLIFQDVPSVFSASKYEQKVTVAPASVSIVTADEIHKYGYRNLAEVLCGIPGLFVSFDRNYQYLGVRGFSRPGDYNARILLLIDGQRTNDSIYDAASIGNEFLLDVDLIERIEFIRGPSSSLYGTSAFFGVLNIITRNGRDLRGPEARIVTGSLETYQGRLGYGNKFGNGIELLVSAAYSDSKGNERLYFPEFDEPDTNNGIAENADNQRYENYFFKLGFRDLTLSAAYTSRRKNVPTASYGTVFNDRRTFSVDTSMQVGLKYEHAFGNGLAMLGNLIYGFSKYDGDYVYDYSEEGDLTNLVINKDGGHGKWWTLDLQGAKSFSNRHKLIFGMEYRNNPQQDQFNFDVEVYLDDRRNSDVWAIYIQEEYALSERWLLNIGLRHDEYETFGDSTNPRLALIFNSSEQTTWKFLYGEAFRAPNVYELFYHDGFSTQKPAENLRPESIQSTELVMERQIGSHWRGSFSTFFYELKRLITLSTDPIDDLFIFRNEEEVEAFGAELFLEGSWPAGWKGHAGYSYQRAREEKTEALLDNSPRHMAQLKLIAPLYAEKLFAGMEIRYMDDRTTGKGNLVASHTLANLNFHLADLAPGLNLSAGVYDLFDQRFEDPGLEEHQQLVIERDGRTLRLQIHYVF